MTSNRVVVHLLDTQKFVVDHLVGVVLATFLHLDGVELNFPSYSGNLDLVLHLLRVDHCIRFLNQYLGDLKVIDSRVHLDGSF